MINGSTPTTPRQYKGGHRAARSALARLIRKSLFGTRYVEDFSYPVIVNGEFVEVAR